MRPKVFRKVKYRGRSFGRVLITVSAVVRLVTFLIGLLLPTEIAVSDGKPVKVIAKTVLDTVGKIVDDLIADLK